MSMLKTSHAEKAHAMLKRAGYASGGAATSMSEAITHGHGRMFRPHAVLKHSEDHFARGGATRAKRVSGGAVNFTPKDQRTGADAPRDYREDLDKDDDGKGDNGRARGGKVSAFARGGGARGHGKKRPHTQVNVIVPSGAGAGAGPAMVPRAPIVPPGAAGPAAGIPPAAARPPMMAGPPPGGAMPPGAMPPGAGGLPPGAGGLPPGVVPRARGGATRGQHIKMDSGAGGGEGRLEKIREYGGRKRGGKAC